MTKASPSGQVRVGAGALHWQARAAATVASHWPQSDESRAGVPVPGGHNHAPHHWQAMSAKPNLSFQEARDSEVTSPTESLLVVLVVVAVVVLVARTIQTKTALRVKRVSETYNLPVHE